MAYVTRVRMHRAAELLRDPQLSVAEVADRVGYRSEAAFARVFRRELGQTPAAARRARRGAQERSAGQAKQLA